MTPFFYPDNCRKIIHFEKNPRCDEEDLSFPPMTLDSRHPLLHLALDRASGAFDPADPAATGTGLLASLMKEACEVEHLKELRFKDCKELGIGLPGAEAFCPVEEEKHW